MCQWWVGPDPKVGGTMARTLTFAQQAKFQLHKSQRCLHAHIPPNSGKQEAPSQIRDTVQLGRSTQRACRAGSMGYVAWEAELWPWKRVWPREESRGPDREAWRSVFSPLDPPPHQYG